ncbi:MAG: polyprenol monophosphomannose synthase [Candidatus Marinimicrobia bacterium]|jgi:dolichol-phosphate mannosyltransferase|nr:polyprenol monophosphomannose synthase [Candidatus Neomarinimicrobiota bacterium]MDP6612038.1 polyprenol monophosphomannose synthase [Candidatus Neomarinimicrobiota bacterium]|tara:strand:- start:17708 stop:18424 length:717 start_codon:yes stop_codon:yes gene_type:complete
MKTLIISPTYNEHKNVATLIELVFTINPGYHLLIVDDSSPDGTGEIVRGLQSKFPNLHLEIRQKKDGLGKAYIYGFHWALKRDYDTIVQMDADMSHDPMEIPAMLSLLNKNDLVIGSRYIQGVSVVNWPIRRLIMSYGANLYSRIATGMPLKDATGGYKVWSQKVLAAIELDKVKSSGYSFQIEMNFRAWIKGFKLKEHPIIFIDRTIGESKMSRSIMLEAVWMVWRLRIWRIFGWNK